MDYWNKACDAADFVIKNKIQPVKLVRGKTPNVYRYFIDKYYIDITPNKEIISYGVQWEYKSRLIKKRAQ